MQITNVSVMPLTHGKFDCIAICQFTIENSFIITGLKLYEKNGKRYLVFPKNEHNRKQMKYCHPINDAVYNEVLMQVTNEYNRIMNVEDPTYQYKEFIKEDNFYKKNFGIGLGDDMIATITQKQMIKEAHDAEVNRIETAAAALEQPQKKEVTFEDIQKYSKQYDEEHPVEHFDDQDVADAIMNNDVFNVPCVDAEEALNMEQQAMQIELLKLLAQNTDYSTAKQYLIDKYRNCYTAIQKSFAVLEANREEKETV